MSSGIHENTYAELFQQDNWITAFLTQNFEHRPGTFYRYSTHGSHMLSAILEKATNTKLSEFMDKHFFSLLDIENPSWEFCPQNHTCGGMGLSISADSLAKIATLLLNKGVYNNQRIISEEYLAEATRKHIYKNTEKNPALKEYSGLDYGYQFHINKYGHYRMDGGFGQICLVMPDRNLSFIVTSVNSKIEPLMRSIYYHFTNENDRENLAIDICVEDLTYNYGKNFYLNKFDIPFIDRMFRLHENELNFERIHLETQNKGLRVRIYLVDNNEIELWFSINEMHTGTSRFIKDIMWHNQVYQSWMGYHDETFFLQVVYLETPYVVNYIMKVNEDLLDIDFKINKSLTLKNSKMVGYAMLTNANH